MRGERRADTGTIVFRSIFIGVTFVLTAAVAYALKTLWEFLELYEVCRPDTAITAYAETLDANRSVIGDKVMFDLNEFETADDLKKLVDEQLNGELTYVRSGRDSTPQKTVYNIRVNGNVVASVTVIPTDEQVRFGLKKYTVSDMEVFKVVTSGSYEATAPSNAVLYCNGKEVDKKYITKTKPAYPETENFHGYFDGNISMVTYKIDGFLNEPRFSAKNIFGEELSAEDGKFVLKTTKNEELSELALTFSETYSKYVMNDARLWEPAEYLAPDMPLYSKLSHFTNYWHNRHTGYDFQKVEVGEPMFYSDKCASVHITYEHVLYGVDNDTDGEPHFATDHTVYLTKIDDEWKVTELVVN